MSESMELKKTEAPPPTRLETFLLKVGIITAAAMIFFYFTAYIANSYISAQLDALGGLKGGKAFWLKAETKLHSLADEPDLPAEQKARILNSLKKLSDRYRPYLEAAGVVPPATK